VWTVATLADGLARLGLTAGDTVLVRASLRRLGDVAGHRATALIKATLAVVGSRGTLAALAFNPLTPFPAWRNSPVIGPDTPPGSGGLAAAMVRWPGAVRSQHPTCSWVAIGANAGALTAGHDASSASFHPVGALLEADGVLVNVGNVIDSPGFSTVHWVQSRRGLSTRNLLAGRIGARFPGGVFHSHDFPGCSQGFDKFYGAYVQAGALRAGMVGDAYAILGRARELVAVEDRLVSANPRFPLCDAPDCMHCRGLVTYNKRDWPAFWSRWAWRKLTGR
jgi:aminoglycoside N3'-acetyltransferase